MSRLVVVSNRLPDLAGRPPSGGLVTGLEGMLRLTGGLWVGWSGRSRPYGASQATPRDGEGFSLLGIDLARQDIEGYYDGFANRTLWPLCHGRLDLAEMRWESYRSYRKVNADLSRLVSGATRSGDAIWVHDYHLIPLGRELRRRGITNPIGFFLHVPVPPRETLAALPWASELVEALAAYDLVGVQATRDWWNLADYALRERDGALAEDGTIAVGGGRLQAGVYPISIDTPWFTRTAAAAGAKDAGPGGGTASREQVVLGVDRLDYSKGVPQRLRAFAELLDRYPEYRRQVRLIQVSAPSREDVPEYRRLRRAVAQLCGEINGRHAELDWTPVRFINRSLSQEMLAGLYRSSRVGFVTPLSDGMNLIAKEYVACQDPDDPGVLVLSRFAGAAESMDDAVLVNPYDGSAMVAALRTALAMPVEERKARWNGLMRTLERHTVQHWGRRFLADLMGSVRGSRVSDHSVVPRYVLPVATQIAQHPGGPRPSPASSDRAPSWSAG